MTPRNGWALGVLMLAATLLAHSGARAEGDTEPLVDDLECPDGRITQPPIDIGPCPEGQVCWKFPGGTSSATSVEGTSSPESTRVVEERDCSIRGEIFAKKIGYFCVSPEGGNRRYPASYAQYSVQPTASGDIETVAVQRKGSNFRWLMSNCRTLKPCNAGHGGGGKKCGANGAPKGAQGQLIGPFRAVFTLHPKESTCPTGTTKVGSNPTRCEGPVKAIELKGS